MREPNPLIKAKGPILRSQDVKKPQTIHELVDPFLTLLGEKIREQTFTELEVEEVLGWDRKHIQQLKAGRKRLRVQEVLSVLGVIGVEPGDFFAELYALPPRPETPQHEIAELSALADSLANLLVKNGRVTASDLARAVAARAGKDLLPGAEEVAEKAAETTEAPAKRAAAGTVEASQKP